MDEDELVEYFRTQMRQDPEVPSAVAAIRTLLEFLKRDQSETILGLRENLTRTIGRLGEADSSVAVSSGGELFLRFISLTSLEHPDLSQCKKVMVERGELFLKKISLSRSKVAKLCHTFIKDGAVNTSILINCILSRLSNLLCSDSTSDTVFCHSQKILTHSSSRVVLKVLESAAADKKRFTVYVTESQPDSAGQKMADKLRKLNIPVTVVLDAAVGYIMEKVDLVIVGAEGVVESGGIINKIGTYQLAVCSKAHNKPFYVVAESFKFVRLYPLNQQDVPDRFKYKADTLKAVEDLAEEHPMIDYTPPSLITLLFTDLGVLTPSAVSDELIKLYL
uniref:Translation initiation factor eIF2B subunit alpha n=1 Tax=Esox lucius TaxID=8010 RepID=A0AAY5L7V6_ESOLU